MNTVCTATEVETVLDIDAVEVEAVDDIDESIEVAIEVEVVLVGESRMDTGSSTTPRVSTDDVQHLRANKARAAAAAEGLELVPSSKNQTGFKGVTLTRGRYYVDVCENGMTRHLGGFATREEAALCYARHIGAERAAAEAAKERGEGLNTTKPLTADEARAAAAAEGLELVPSSKNQTGFKGVTLTHGRYYVNICVHVHCSISTSTALSRSDRPMMMPPPPPPTPPCAAALAGEQLARSSRLTTTTRPREGSTSEGVVGSHYTPANTAGCPQGEPSTEPSIDEASPPSSPARTPRCTCTRWYSGTHREGQGSLH
jgi:hypothetical protein